MTGGSLRTHEVRLRSGRVTLRPLTEDDWDLVVGWWNDPEIAADADANERPYSLGQVPEVMREATRSMMDLKISSGQHTMTSRWVMRPVTSLKVLPALMSLMVEMRVLQRLIKPWRI